MVCARWARKNQEGTMSAIYVLGGTVAVGLLVYLVIALLTPEVFS
jgi:K+-transporting ATPase KdpF subunit